MTDDKPKAQIDKFRDAARELGTDNDPERFAEKVRKLSKAGRHLSKSRATAKNQPVPSEDKG